ncbi:hypothetical protein M3N55_04280 [Roseibaca sp. V10]|uniref:Uncharacterized protein n=1 Tax=Roseinatronobacter domitianus TaxID=2940293 RepID=A0ABT0M015_9RHOB|nr:hypothetical protein [Roseibaca domitiana]MCL1627938.1 hypothetical protein [Roseibaca domitiana]
MNQSKQIPKALKAIAWTSVLMASLVYIAALWSDLVHNTEFFVRAGALSVFLVVLLFFVSQWTGFFTFLSADNIDNMNHAAQRSYLTPFEGYLLVSGTLVWGFGDWCVCSLKIGSLNTCSF